MLTSINANLISCTMTGEYKPGRHENALFVFVIVAPRSIAIWAGSIFHKYTWCESTKFEMIALVRFELLKVIG